MRRYNVPSRRLSAPKLNAKQARLLQNFISAGDNLETGHSNESEFWVSALQHTYRALWRRGFLQIIDEHRDKPLLRYDITPEGRVVAETLMQTEGRNTR